MYKTFGIYKVNGNIHKLLLTSVTRGYTFCLLKFIPTLLLLLIKLNVLVPIRGYGIILDKEDYGSKVFEHNVKHLKSTTIHLEPVGME